MKHVFTIGYEGSTIDDFILTLKAAGIQTLADVREVTVSRKKGFSKNTLRARLAEAGIAYAHFRQLGDPKAGREAARRGEFDLFRRIYGAHIALQDSVAALEELAANAASSMTCLMCYERDPKHCHRKIIANQLEFFNLDSFDLYVDKRDRYEQYPEKLRGYSYREGVAAAEQ